MQSTCVALMEFRNPIRRIEVEVRLGKLKNGKAAGKDKVTGEMIKGEGNKVVEWIWRLCNMVFESGVVPEDWRSTVIVSLYKDKGERREFSNYRGISLLSVVGKIYAGILVERVSKMTEGLIGNKQGGFRAVCRYADRQESTGEKTCVYGFYGTGEGL